MADTTSAQNSAAAAGVNADLANAIAQAVGAAVTASMQEITAKLNSIENRVKQRSVDEDVNFEANVTGVFDPYDDARRAGVINNKLALSMAENADALMKEYLKYTAGVWARSLDHFCSTNPDVPPRANRT